MMILIVILVFSFIFDTYFQNLIKKSFKWKFARELDSNFISFYTATPLPGTRFFAYAMMNRLVDGQMDFASAYYVPTVRSHELSKERIFELHKQAVKRFYLRPKFILKTLLGLRSFAEFKNYFIAGMSLVLKK